MVRQVKIRIQFIGRNQLTELTISFPIPRKHDGSIQLDAENGLNARLKGCLVEGNGAVEAAGIGQCQSRQLEGCRPIYEFLGRCDPIEHGVMAMNPEMDHEARYAFLNKGG